MRLIDGYIYCGFKNEPYPERVPSWAGSLFTEVQSVALVFGGFLPSKDQKAPLDDEALVKKLAEIQRYADAYRQYQQTKKLGV
jgi:hypothetical protein